MLPTIISQLGPDGLKHLKRLANDVVANKISAGSVVDDDVPELVENFEEAANKDVDNLTKKADEVTIS